MESQASSSGSMLSLQGVCKRFGELEVLRGVDLEVKKGEVVCVLGPSGSGKSTLLNLVSALDVPTAGTIEIDGQDIGRMDDDAFTLFRRRKIGLIFQFFNLLPTLSAAENVLLPALVAGESPHDYAERCDTLLGMVGLSGRAAHLPSEMSGGEQQRVAIARALLRRPDVLLADEPTGNLDSAGGARVLDLLRHLVDDGQTCVMVTHDASAAALADRVIFLHDGRVVSEISGGDGGKVADELRDLSSVPPLQAAAR